MVDDEKEDAERALAALLSPLAKLMIDNGLSLQDGVELLKVALVENASKVYPEASASHLSLVTGVHRKDIRRLENSHPSPQKTTAAARVISIWQNDEDFCEAGKPRPLPRGGPNGFDDLVSRAKVDAAPATIGSLLINAGNVEERDGIYYLISASVVPEDRSEKLKVAVATLKPHLETTVSNLSSANTQLDQALRYSHLSIESAKELEKEASRLALAMLQELNSKAHRLQQKEEGTNLFVTGVFTHTTEHET